MDRRKIDSISRKATFSRRRADALITRLCNTEGAVLISSADVVKHIQDPSASSSARQTRILKYQAKLDRLMKELEESKEHEMVLRKRLETTLEKCNMKEIIDPTMEDLVTFKQKLENLNDVVMKKREELLASSPLIRLEDKKNKKNKVGLEFSSGQNSLSNMKIYGFSLKTV